MTRAILWAVSAAVLCLAAGCGHMGSSEGEKVMAAQLEEARQKIASLDADNRRLNSDVHRALEERERFQHEMETKAAVLAERDALIVSLQAQLKDQGVRLDGMKDEIAKVQSELASIREALAGAKKPPANP
jgi:chromosome segregation ATPase